MTNRGCRQTRCMSACYRCVECWTPRWFHMRGLRWHSISAVSDRRALAVHLVGRPSLACDRCWSAQRVYICLAHTPRGLHEPCRGRSLGRRPIYMIFKPQHGLARTGHQAPHNTESAASAMWLHSVTACRLQSSEIHRGKSHALGHF